MPGINDDGSPILPHDPGLPESGPHRKRTREELDRMVQFVREAEKPLPPGNKPAQPAKYPSHMAVTCGSCESLRAENEKLKTQRLVFEKSAAAGWKLAGELARGLKDKEEKDRGDFTYPAGNLVGKYGCSHDPHPGSVCLGCYKTLRAENEKLKAVLKPADLNLSKVSDNLSRYDDQTLKRWAGLRDLSPFARAAITEILRLRALQVQARKLALDEGVRALSDTENVCDHEGLDSKCHGCTSRMVTYENAEIIRALKNKEES